jgi:peroxiredoxin
MNDQQNGLNLEDLNEEPMFEIVGEQLKVGATAPDFAFVVAAGGVSLSLYSLLANGPVLLNFIKGTWCPFCQTYMGRLNKWKGQLIGKSISSVVISNETPDIIRAWLKVHPMDFMFGSVLDPKVFASYGVRIQDHAFARPATFLIDSNKEIRLIHNLSRGAKWEATVGAIKP